jgi:NhaP-type Na+/H+ or K+/H+ antiporter
MKVDSELAGILVAVGFFVMGFVSVPIAKGFLLGAFLVGTGIAVVLWLIQRRRESHPLQTRILNINGKAKL